MFFGSNSISKLFFIFALFVAFGGTAFAVSPFFDRDEKTDLAVFRPGNRNWYAHSSENQSFSALQWGTATDRLVPADYDGDGLTDYAVWRPENGFWYVLRSSNKQLLAVKWGMQTAISFGTVSDEPVVGDYDGDGTADLAVWRPTTGVWYVLKSSKNFDANFADSFQWGKLGDIPVPADYDGDGRTDYAVFRYSENRWYIFQSKTATWLVSNLGAPGTDLLAPEDYTGDGKTDIAVYRHGLWIVERSEDHQLMFFNFGAYDDTPVPDDYDGDNKADFAVYRRGAWYIMQSATARMRVHNFGMPDDVPVGSLKVKPSIVGIP